VVLVAYGLVMLAVALWPSPVDQPVSGQIHDILDRAHDAGAPQAVGYSMVEFGGNVLLFVPLGLLLVAVLPPHRWWVAPLIGIAFSAAIETTQGLFLPERTASWLDLASNTIGALLGTAIALLIRAGVRGRRVGQPAQ
jgi:glycopeptide antibiotics resistance protein